MAEDGLSDKMEEIGTETADVVFNQHRLFCWRDSDVECQQMMVWDASCHVKSQCHHGGPCGDRNLHGAQFHPVETVCTLAETCDKRGVKTSCRQVNTHKSATSNNIVNHRALGTDTQHGGSEVRLAVGN